MQQPPGQVFTSHEHVPLVVSHRPLPQAAQVAPAVPHEPLDSDDHDSHVPVGPPLQQPLGHEIESQRHAPRLLLHSSPVAQAEQAAPAVPQEMLVSELYGSHVPFGPPLQQPLGHEVASQTHCPVLVLQSSIAPHALQLAPPAPHDPLFSLLSASHEPALQQPPHEAPPHEHAPAAQACPPAHAAQLEPLAPHSEDVCDAYATHVLLLQQPPGHDVASQTHWPVALHSCPDAQAPQAAPLVPHEAVDCPEYASQAPAAVQHPPGHVFLSHPHTPVMVSQRTPPAHAAHAAPAVPHSDADCDPGGTHVVPLQQPLGHDVASHMHVPAPLPLALQSWPVAHGAQVAPATPHEAADSEV